MTQSLIDNMFSNQTICGRPTGNIDSHSLNINEYIRKKLKEKYGNDRPCRVFHAKSIGLVEAEFKVDIDEGNEFLKEGIFEKAKTYKAWIRFSNSSSTPGNDSKKAVRGMAIKILGAKNGSAGNENMEGNNQDIILSNSRNFVPPAGRWALDGIKIFLGKWYERAIALINVLSHSVHGTTTFLNSVITTPNILEEVYYSGTPYAFGQGRAIKWQARPLKTITSVMPENPHPDFLRQRLIADLSSESKDVVAFALFVQFQENRVTEPIDDSSVVWRTPFYKVATIKLPKQNLETAERIEKDQNMSFSPGHFIAEHAPLGSINLMRAKVYDTMAKERFLHRGKFKNECLK